MKLLLVSLILLVLAAMLFVNVKAVAEALRPAVASMLEPLHRLLTAHMQRTGLQLNLFYFAEGTRIQFSQTLGAPITVSGATNANPTVLTAAAHGLVDNDLALYVPNSWEDAKEGVYKIDELSAGTLSLVDLDTTDTQWYSPGGGAGSLRKITNWVDMPQVLDITPNGGDVRLTQVPLLARRNDVQVPTGFNAGSYNLQLAWDPADAAYKQMVQISRALRPVAFRQLMSGGAQVLGYGYMSASQMPQMQRNQVTRIQVGMTIVGPTTSYAT